MVKNKKKEKKNVSFWDEVHNEMKKVKWLSKKEMVKYSITTLCFIVLFAVFFFGIDAIFAFVKGLIG